MLNITNTKKIFAVAACSLTMGSFAAFSQAETGAPSEPRVIVEDLSRIDQLHLPTPFVQTGPSQSAVGDGSVTTYQFVLDLKNQMIVTETAGGRNEEEVAVCVTSDRINRIRDILDRNQVCDFSQVPANPQPGVSCLTMVYPDYMILPTQEGMIGVGSKVDSCAVPTRELCELKQGAQLRREIDLLTSDFVDHLEEASPTGHCL